MDRLAAWIWRRFRRHFTGALLVTVITAAMATIGVPAFVAAYSLLRDPALWGLILPAAAGILVAALVTFWRVGDQQRVVIRWGRGEDVSPQLVQDAALRLPERIANTVMVVGGPLLVPSLAGIGYLTMGRRWEVGVGLVLGLTLTVMAVVYVLGVALRLLYWPVLMEVAPFVGEVEAADFKAWSLRFRITMSLGVSTVAGIMIGTGILQNVGDQPTLYVLAELVGFVVAVYFVLLVGTTVVGPSLQPLQSLTAGAERVAAGDYDARVPIASLDELGRLTVAFNEMQRGLKERATLQAAFGSYVDPALAERLLAQDSSVFDGEEVDVTVFFADVRGFTTYASGASAHEAVARLNQLFEVIVPVIRDAGGHANVFIGDGVLAVFGTPNPLEDHAARAVGAAVEIQRRVFTTFGEGLRIGIGVNTGRVIAGTIGGGGRLEFTVIGDPVNVAARVEEFTKTTGDPILLTQATLDALPTAPDGLVDRGEHQLRGKAEVVALYALS